MVLGRLFISVLMCLFGRIHQLIFVAQVALGCLDDPHDLLDVWSQHVHESTEHHQHQHREDETATARYTGGMLFVAAALHPTLETLDHLILRQ